MLQAELLGGHAGVRIGEVPTLRYHTAAVPNVRKAAVPSYASALTNVVTATSTGENARRARSPIGLKRQAAAVRARAVAAPQAHRQARRTRRRLGP
mmetsp:Transcript_7586/g.23637  ORF Transcript_7586/g.23637 Transcript_7586/m.23637 type:complete len:96 (-) Transcript_7586:1909-2196(-)